MTSRRGRRSETRLAHLLLLVVLMLLIWLAYAERIEDDRGVWEEEPWKVEYQQPALAPLQTGLQASNGARFGVRTRRFADYYSSRLIGGRPPEVEVTGVELKPHELLEPPLARMPVTSFRTVPEPTVSTGLATGLMLMLLRRRRKTSV